MERGGRGGEKRTGIRYRDGGVDLALSGAGPVKRDVPGDEQLHVVPMEGEMGAAEVASELSAAMMMGGGGGGGRKSHRSGLLVGVGDSAGGRGRRMPS